MLYRMLYDNIVLYFLGLSSRGTQNFAAKIVDIFYRLMLIAKFIFRQGLLLINLLVKSQMLPLTSLHFHFIIHNIQNYTNCEAIRPIHLQLYLIIAVVTKCQTSLTVLTIIITIQQLQMFCTCAGH